VGKDKKKKRVKKALKEMPYSASPLGSAATWRIGCQEELSKALDWAAHPSVSLEFDYFGTRYKGTAYPVREAQL
jgi:hypothetical protein